MLDLDEGRNRVSIGVMPGTDLSPNSEFARNVTRRGVPMAALNVMPIGFAEPIRRRMFSPDTSLGHFADTLAGGFRYANNSNGCTTGFTSRLSSGEKGFISASHCSPSKWGYDATTYIRQAMSGTVIGSEYYDMGPGTCPLLWGCSRYRYSDANGNVIDTTLRPVDVGNIARPSTRQHNSGSDTTLNTSSPYIQVIGETSSITQNADIDQIGATSGWIYSEVLHTCVTYSSAPLPYSNDARRCAYITEGDAKEGDSGGPVFYYSGGQATAAGIIAAKFTPADYHWTIFSKFMYVRNEIESSGHSFSILPGSTPPSYYPHYANFSGTSLAMPNASCNFYMGSDLSYIDVKWWVNGTLIGTNYMVSYSSAVSYQLEVDVNDGTNVAWGSHYVTVSSEAGTCYDQ